MKNALYGIVIAIGCGGGDGGGSLSVSEACDQAAHAVCEWGERCGWLEGAGTTFEDCVDTSKTACMDEAEAEGAESCEQSKIDACIEDVGNAECNPDVVIPSCDHLCE